jgi:hypothetical protein
MRTWFIATTPVLIAAGSRTLGEECPEIYGNVSKSSKLVETACQLRFIGRKRAELANSSNAI